MPETTDKSILSRVYHWYYGVMLFLSLRDFHRTFIVHALTEIDTESRHALRGRLNDVQLDNLVNEKKKKKRSPTANAYSISPFDF